MKRLFIGSHRLWRWTSLWMMLAGLLALSFPGEPRLVQAEPITAGYRTFSYGTPNGRCNSTPTGEKPESKLWWNDGYWWGSLCNDAAEAYHIYRFDLTTHSWIDTGTRIDDRPNTKGDVLWDDAGQKLYVVSHVFTNSGSASSSPSVWGRLYRYSYNASTNIYSLDAGFPVTVTKGRSETLTIAKDSTGQLWVTYVEGGKVMGNRSVNGDLVWGEPLVLPFDSQAVSVTSDDISSVVAFDGNKIGVMWSNQNTDEMYFAVHRDSDADNVWQLRERALPGPNNETSDDHINLKSLQTDGSGRVFAAIKTSLSASSAPMVMLLVRQPGGGWSHHVFGRVRDGHTRPLVLLDEQNDRLYMFATAPESGGTIYYKSTNTNSISFEQGLGTPFIQSATDTKINNATSTKQNLNSTTGLLVLAGDQNSRYYFHNYLSLGGSVPPTATPTSGTAPTATATPTNTPTPQNTPSNTPTPQNTPSNTPTAATFTPTNTPTAGGGGTNLAFSPSDDALVKDSRPDRNYGSDDHLRLRLASETYRSYLKFAVSGVSAPVQRATLRLYAYDGSDVAGSVFAVANTYAASTTPWTEGGLTWNNAPPLIGTALDTEGPVPNGAWAEFDVTAAVQGDGTYSFGLSTTSGNSVFFFSTEATANQPELIITTSGAGGSTATPTNTPTPTTVTETPTNTPTAATFTPTNTPTAGGGGTNLAFSPSDDALVKDSRPDRNYGSDDHLRLRLASETYRSYLKFAVSGVSAPVQRATLRLYAYDGSDVAGSVFAVANTYAASTTPWTEGGLTWNNAPPLIGTALDTEGPVPNGAWAEFDVTAAVQGDGTYSFGLSTTSSNSVFFFSTEAPGNQPELILELGS